MRIVWVCKLFNNTLKTKTMPNEWNKSALVHIYIRIKKIFKTRQRIIALS